MPTRLASVTVPVLVVVAAALGIHAQTGAPKGEWSTYGADLGNTHYSPLAQIDATNFSKLEVAWRFKTDHLGPRPEYQRACRGATCPESGIRRRSRSR